MRDFPDSSQKKIKKFHNYVFEKKPLQNRRKKWDINDFFKLAILKKRKQRKF